jgi:hypothetical protein
MSALALHIVLSPMPENWLSLVVGLQSGRHDVVPGTPLDDGVVFDESIEVVRAKDGSPDFHGPLVHGKRLDRFLYVTWGNPAMFRRLKLYLSPLTRAHWGQPGLTWNDIARGAVALDVTGRLADGTPACGTAPALWKPR